MHAKFSLKDDQNMVRPGLPRRAIAVFAGVLIGTSGVIAPSATMAGAPVAVSDSGTLGVVAADEPHAAIAAREILEAGGSVGDAATALYFTLAVTYPVAAGLGGGGVCLHYNAETGTGESIDFLPRAARGGGTIAVPGAVKGLNYLHARYGRLSWAEVLAPAERLAAQGFPLTRALSNALQANRDTITKSPFLSALFTDSEGSLLSEGQEVQQIPLASTLAILRGHGASGFYSAPFGSEIISAAAAQGGALSRSDLADYRAEEAPAAQVPAANGVLLTPADKTGAGALAAAAFPDLAAAPGADPAERAQAARAAVAKALRGFGVAGTPKDFGSTGFVVADRAGETIACGLTLTRPFGTAREVERTGFALVPAPAGSASGLAGAFLMPLVAADAKRRDILFSGVGTGGADGVSTVAALGLAALGRDQATLEATWAAAPSPGNSVNILACTKGLTADLRSCMAAADPNGNGAALAATPQSKPDPGSSGGGGGFLGLF